MWIDNCPSRIINDAGSRSVTVLEKTKRKPNQKSFPLGGGEIAQGRKCLLTKCKIPSLIPGSGKKKKKKIYPYAFFVKEPFGFVLHFFLSGAVSS